MIISRTPFRISFSGGGSDFKDFYSESTGTVLSVTIDKYIYLSMHPLFNSNCYHLKYSENETPCFIDRIKHPIIKEVFSRYGIFGIDFNSSSDIPSGTGLGSSSSFTVGLINLCNAYQNTFVRKEEIAKEACEIEIEKLKSPIGKQDQYAAACGGMNFIQFNPDESVVVEKINLSEKKKKELENSLILFYLGGQRMSGSILSDQKKRISQNVPILKKMVKLTEDLKNELKNDSIDNFGTILNEGWQYKKELSTNISNGTVDHWYEMALDSGAKGGKLLGSGGTGFLLLFVPEGKDILRSIMRLYELPFKFENSGTTIIY
jgi:D-glycero-alpha-D-manno-heptose-7-phosphate kinase